MIDESWYRRPPGILEHTSAGGVIVRRAHGQLYVALVREGGLPAYVLPKGHVEPGEALDCAARREIAEESGLTDLTLIDELAVRERLDYQKRSWKTTHYFLFVTRQAKGTPTDSAHHSEVEWFPIDALPPMFWPEQRELIEVNRAKITGLVSRRESSTDLQRATMKDFKSTVRQQFGRRAQAYARSASHAGDVDLTSLAEHLSLKSNDRVLDVATGTGFTALALHPHVHAVVGLDLTREMLAEARRLAGTARGVVWVEGDAEALPFGDEAFTVVTCRRSAHHFAHLDRALAEMRRVLRPGGHLGIADQVSPEGEEGRRLMEQLEVVRDPSHMRTLTPDEWGAVFQAHGLALQYVEFFENRASFDEWLDRAGVDGDRRMTIDSLLAWAPAAALVQVGYEVVPSRTFTQRRIVLVGQRLDLRQ